MKKFNFTHIFLTALMTVLAFSCSGNAGKPVIIEDYCYMPPDSSKWKEAGSEEKAAISPWVINGIESVPQQMYSHEETGSIFVVSTMLFDASRERETQSEEYFKAFLELASEGGNVTYNIIESETDVKAKQAALSSGNGSALVRTVYYSELTEQALCIDVYTTAQALPLLKKDLSTIMDSVALTR